MKNTIIIHPVQLIALLLYALRLLINLSLTNPNPRISFDMALYLVIPPICTYFVLLVLSTLLIYPINAINDAHFEGDEIIAALKDLATHGLMGNQQVKWILDVGALNGGFSIALNKTGLFPDANYFLIEANTRYASVLEGLGFPHAIALVGDVDGAEVSYFTLNDDIISNGTYIDTGSSIYKEHRNLYDEHSNEHKRQTFRIDTIIETIGMGDVEFQVVKFDIQGSELKAIRGAEALLSRSAMMVAILETSIIPYNEGDDFPTKMAIQLEMERLGFVLVDIVSVSRLLSMADRSLNVPVQADYIFVKRASFRWHVKGLQDPLTWDGAPDPFPCHFELASQISNQMDTNKETLLEYEITN